MCDEVYSHLMLIISKTGECGATCHMCSLFKGLEGLHPLNLRCSCLQADIHFGALQAGAAFENPLHVGRDGKSHCPKGRKCI